MYETGMNFPTGGWQATPMKALGCFAANLQPQIRYST